MCRCPSLSCLIEAAASSCSLGQHATMWSLTHTHRRRLRMSVFHRLFAAAPSQGLCLFHTHSNGLIISSILFLFFNHESQEQAQTGHQGNLENSLWRKNGQPLEGEWNKKKNVELRGRVMKWEKALEESAAKCCEITDIHKQRTRLY